jgi:hypothetical protein
MSKIIIIILRGHIRNSFENDKLYNLINKINHVYIIHIYIHTWNIQQTDVSWITVEKINNIITKEIIYDYFKDLNSLIKHIIIDDDTKINLIGNLTGTIGPFCPIIGWKRYIYGLYQIINYVKNRYSDEFIINFRFDIFSNSNNISEDQILYLIYNNNNNKFKKNIFLYNSLKFGLDNVFCGNSQTMYKLCKYFNEELDYILNKNITINNQEFLLFIENEIIF